MIVNDKGFYKFYDSGTMEFILLSTDYDITFFQEDNYFLPTDFARLNFVSAGEKIDGIEILRSTFSIKDFFQKNNLTYDFNLKKVITKDLVKSNITKSEIGIEFLSVGIPQTNESFSAFIQAKRNIIYLLNIGAKNWQ